MTWQELLESMYSTETKSTGNLLLLGPKDCGKKSILYKIAEKIDPEFIEKERTNQSQIPKNQKSISNQYAPLYSTLQMKNMIIEEENNNTSNTTSNNINNHENQEHEMKVWICNTTSQLNCIAHFIQASELVSNTAAAICMDLAKPWEIEKVLNEWSLAIEKFIQSKLQNEEDSKITVEDAQSNLRQHISVCANLIREKKIDSLAGAVNPCSADIKLPEGTLEKNIGIPIIVVGHQTDAHHFDSTSSDYIQFYLRRFCLRYGGMLIYISTKSDKNCDTLIKCIYHSLFRNSDCQLPLPQLVENASIFLPCGFDSLELIHGSFIGASKEWDEVGFSNMIPPPVQPKEFDRADTEDMVTWMNNLRSLSEDKSNETKLPQKTADVATSASRSKSMNVGRQGHGGLEKEVNPAHLESFFNNLLQRDEKRKPNRQY